MIPPEAPLPIRRAIAVLSHRQTPLPPPRLLSLSGMADACKSMDQLKQIHAQMVVTARIQDGFAASRLLNFCAISASGNLNYAMKLFRNTPEPNSFVWNTIIRAQAGGLNPVQGLLLYVEMRKRGIRPGKHTFPFVLKACSYVKSAKYCTQVHTHVLKFGLESESHAVNGLMRAYSVSGALWDARQMFDQLCERNLSIWTTMICGYAQNNHAGEAIELFHCMISDGFEPNGVVLSSVLSACSQSGCLDLGEQIHMYIKEKHIVIGVILGTALVNMYAKNGALAKAKLCFDGMQEKNIVTWNAMICGLAVHGHAEDAIQFFQELEEKRVKPSAITFIGVLSACCHAGLLDYGRRIFYSMENVYHIEPRLEHYGCMVDLLGRRGQLVEAEELIRGMPWEADVVIWGAVLSGCKEFGNIEVAERVVEEILELDPHNHGAYVILSNMYAEAGRWEDVVKRRKVMKDGSLKKTAGWSLVDDDA